MLQTKLLVTFLVFSISNFTRSQFVLPQQLKDGLLIARGEDILIEDGYWRVLVTLDVPKLPEQLVNYLTAVEKALAHIRSKFQPVEREHWEARLKRVKLRIGNDYLHNGRNHHRIKRGLFNVIGVISRTLFGTATSAEVRETQEMIMKVNSNNQAVNHLVHDLASTVNQSRIYIEENRDRINTLTKEVNNINKYLEGFQRRISAVINQNYHRHQAERLIESLELVADVYTDQVEHYHRQRTAMEIGVLTEDLVPIPVLEEIVMKAQTHQREMIRQVEWYYQFVRIQPLWGEDDVIAFQLKLPLVGATRWLHYLINTYPVPQLNGTLTTLDVAPNVGYDPHTNGLIIPRECRGRQPMVCQATPVRVGRGLDCERGIISNHKEKRQNCLIKVEQSVQVDEVWYTGENQVVLSTWGDSLYERCKDKSERVQTLAKGVYLFNMTKTCSYSGPTWRAQYTPTYTEKMHIQHRIVYDIAPVVIPDLVDIQGWQHEAGRTDLQALGEVKKFRLSDLMLQQVKIPSYQEGWFIGTLIAVIVIVFIIAGVLFWFYRIRQRKVKTPKVATKSDPLHEVTHLEGCDSPIEKATPAGLMAAAQGPLPSVAEREQSFKFKFNDTLQ